MERMWLCETTADIFMCCKVEHTAIANKVLTCFLLGFSLFPPIFVGWFALIYGNLVISSEQTVGICIGFSCFLFPPYFASPSSPKCSSLPLAWFSTVLTILCHVIFNNFASFAVKVKVSQFSPVILALSWHIKRCLIAFKVLSMHFFSNEFPNLLRDSAQCSLSPVSPLKVKKGWLTYFSPLFGTFCTSSARSSAHRGYISKLRGSLVPYGQIAYLVFTSFVWGVSLSKL